MQTLTAAAARRAALAAQGFADPRPSGTPNRRHLQRMLDRLRLIQLDSVNVAVRAHYMPAFSRLGPYPAALMDDAAWSHSARRPRLLVEYWAHEASLLPMADWPLLLSGAKRRGWWRHYRELAERESVLVEDVLAAVKELGPIGAGALEAALVPSDGRDARAARNRRPGASWWDRSDVKRICEFLFGMGQLTTGTRVNFQRLYDLPERVLPPEVLGAAPIEPDEAARRLITNSAAALGVATEPDLRDYYRLAPLASRNAVAELVDAGQLEPVRVRGWTAQAYQHPQARIPRRVQARALLCPFDPLIWERSRTERIFDFRYRIEIYTPAAQRRHGYYVYPFLLDDALVARVDVKADRAARLLRVPGAFGEAASEPTATTEPIAVKGSTPGAGVDQGRVVAELAAELRVMAEWLELDGVAVGERGDLARPLAAALGGHAHS